MSAVLSHLRTLAGRMFTSKYLLVTNVTSFGVLMGAGDIGVQQMNRLTKSREERGSMDWARTGRMFAIGLAMGPLTHGWYTFLDKLLPSANFRVVSKKLLLDQLIASPLCVFVFLVGTSLLEHKSKEKAVDELYDKFWGIYKVDCLVWPAAQSVNFLLIAPRFRVLYVAVLTLFWDAFLSFYKHRTIFTFNQLARGLRTLEVKFA